MPPNERVELTRGIWLFGGLLWRFGFGGFVYLHRLPRATHPKRWASRIMAFHHDDYI